MPDALCLIADESGPLRNLMRDVLTEAGYEVLQAQSNIELATKVHEPALVSGATMLLVLDAKWASQCAVPISVAATMRQQSSLPPTGVVLVYEFGALGLLESPELHHCRTIAMLEKPFEMDALKEFARTAAAASAESRT
jgi:DNA-binding NtrC family response regulator